MLIFFDKGSFAIKCNILLYLPMQIIGKSLLMRDTLFML